jgi:hypothetical protein
MKNNKWSVESFSSKPIYVVLFCSRNKDNKHLPDFKERRKSFITHKTIEELEEEFNDFVSHGREGEMCRMYYSVNARDPQKIHTQLMHFLFDNPDFNLCSIAPKLAGIAAQKKCALEKHWMFDLDTDDGYAAWAVCQNILLFAPDVKVWKYKTPHGYAIIVDHGFDTRKLMEIWGQIDIDITLKRDDLLCARWKTKGE